MNHGEHWGLKRNLLDSESSQYTLRNREPCGSTSRFYPDCVIPFDTLEYCV